MNVPEEEEPAPLNDERLAELGKRLCAFVGGSSSSSGCADETHPAPPPQAAAPATPTAEGEEKDEGPLRLLGECLNEQLFSAAGFRLAFGRPVVRTASGEHLCARELLARLVCASEGAMVASAAASGFRARTFDVSACARISGAEVLAAMRAVGTAGVTRLVLANMGGATAAEAGAIAALVPALTALDCAFSALDAAALDALLAGLAAPLRALRLAGCRDLTPALFRHAAVRGVVDLDVSCSSTSGSSSSSSGDAVAREVFGGLRALEVLDVAWTGATGDAVKRVATRALRVLRVAGSSVNESVLHRVVRAEPRLAELDLCACAALRYTPKLLRTLAAVERVTLGGGPLDAATVGAVCRSAPALTRLALVACAGLTTDFEGDLCACTRMRDLTVVFCPLIDDNAVRVLDSALPDGATLHHAATDTL